MIALVPLPARISTVKSTLPQFQITNVMFAVVATVLMTTSPSEAAPVFQDQFAIPPNAAGTLPVGWTTGTGTNDDFVSATNLTYSGLAPATAGSWRHDGSANQRYYQNFSTTGLEVDTTIYYSFLFNLNTIGNLANGATSSVIMLSNGTLESPGNGAVASWNFRTDTVDPTKYNIGVNTGFRGSTNASTMFIGGDAGTAFSADQTMLLVASYSYSSTTSSTVNFWVNPDSADLGAATAPMASLSLTGSGSGSGVAVQRLLLNSIKNTSASANTEWTVDAFRVGDTWADVTPVPEPSTVVLLVSGGLIPILLRRRRA